MLFFIKFLTLLHLSYKINSYKKFNNFLYYMVLFYFFVRVDILSSIHSFINTDNIDFFKKIFVFYITYLYLFKNTLFIKNYFYYSKYKLYKNKVNFNFKLEAKPKQYVILNIYLYIFFVFLIIYFSLTSLLLFSQDTLEILYNLKYPQIILFINALFFFFK
jgi:hypothetical protein